MYKGSGSMIKVGGGLSVPVKIQKGIRQGCPMSGQLYSLAIEPVLCLLRKLKSWTINGSFKNESIILSAYTDDITVIVQQQNDVQILKGD